MRDWYFETVSSDLVSRSEEFKTHTISFVQIYLEFASKNLH